MKLFFKILLLFFTFLNANAQNFYLKIEGNSIEETKIIDSITYKSKFKNVALLLEEKKDFETKLSNNGFFDSKLKLQNKINDSTFLFRYKLGKPIHKILINTSNLAINEKESLAIKAENYELKPSEVENWLQNKLKLLEQKGFALAKLKLINQEIENNKIRTELEVNLSEQRKINDLVILGYDKFPKNIKQNWKRKLKNRTFNQDLIKEINTTIETFPFVTSTRNPEILFTKDSTKIFTYLEKTKPNKFDGFIGFANDEKNTKLTFNGYLDLALINILNSGEKFNLYWRNDGSQQSSFNLGTEIPYVFKSPFGTKANLKIFKQDSTFQNTQLNLDLGYYFTYNKKVFLGYQSINSVDIQNNNSVSLNDFNSRFYTLNFDYLKKDIENFLFPDKTIFNIKVGFGNRTITANKTNQFFTELNASHHLSLNNKNTIFIKNQSYYLDSKNFVINELYRFGGINSICGFRENTLQANLFSGIMTEYRYLLAPNLYTHSIIDYGYYQDKTSGLKGNLLGLGFGFGLLSNNGLLHFVYANGSTNNQAIKLSNSIVQISFKTNF